MNINTSDDQAGGRKYSTTIAHILTLKGMIPLAWNQKKGIHITYLVVTSYVSVFSHDTSYAPNDDKS